MKNEIKIDSEMAIMTIQSQCIIFDIDDLPKVSKSKWRLSRGKAVETDLWINKKDVRTTLQRLITGSMYVQWLNGNVFDFRKKNLIPTEKSTQHRGAGLSPKINKMRFEKDYIVIEIISRKSLKEYEVFIDHSDYDLISKYTWSVNERSGYAQARDIYSSPYINKCVNMHRIIMGSTVNKKEIDHINGNRIDNRRLNLRICKHFENMHNTNNSRVKRDIGVRKENYESWLARIQVGKIRYKKTFKTYELALDQRKKWEMEFSISGRTTKHGTVMGVKKNIRDLWVARIIINKTSRSKRFKTKEEAIVQRKIWEEELNPSGIDKPCRL